MRTKATLAKAKSTFKLNGRSLLLSSALCALTLSSSAVMSAEVKMYGIIDTGIIVEHNKMGSKDSEVRAYEEFGINLGPRVGLRGVEDLGNGTKVKLLLENGCR